MSNFVILFRAREGSSPIIDLLGRHPGVNVPIFEQLDGYSLPSTISGDDIARLVALTLATGDFAVASRLVHDPSAPIPRGDGRRVGFKWRIWGPPDRVTQALAEQGVVVFHLFRRRLRQMAASHIFTDTVIPSLERSSGIDLHGGGHLQFKLAELSPEDRASLRSRLAAIRFRIDPAEFVAVMQEIVASKQSVHERYVKPLQQAGVRVHSVLYEDFLADPQAFLNMVHTAIGLDPMPVDAATSHFHKVLTQDPRRQVENLRDVNERPELPGLMAQYRRLIHRDHACLRPKAEDGAHAAG